MTWLLCSIQKLRKSKSITGFLLLPAIVFWGKSSSANNDLANELHNLKASSVVLMILPRMRTRSNLLEADLPKLACAYELLRGPSFEATIETLGQLVTETNRPKNELDLRVGVIFKRGEETLRTFYFEDRGGNYDIAGFSGDRELFAKADLPGRLRTIVRNSEVAPISLIHSQCSGP